MSRFPVIVVDKDGVLCDFVGGVLREFGREDLLSTPDAWPPGVFCVAEAMGVPLGEVKDVAVRERGKERNRSRGAAIDWFRNLAPYAWKDQLLSMLETGAERLLFATSPRLGPIEEYSGAKGWLNRHVGHDVATSFCQPGKGIVSGRSGWLLVDDSPEECASFERHGGTAILFPQPWNANRSFAASGASRISYVRQQLDRLLAYRAGRKHLAGAG